MTQFYKSANEAKQAQSSFKCNQGILNVHVIEARNLCQADRNGTTDPYVVLQLNEAKYQSDIIFNTTNPVFEEGFSFQVNDLNKDILNICMVHDNAHHRGSTTTFEESSANPKDATGKCDNQARNDENIGIGNVEIPLKDLAAKLVEGSEEFDTWIPLQDVESGSLHLRFHLVRKAL